jgi:hypothetical protein
MKVRVKSLETRQNYQQRSLEHLHYDIIVSFTPEELQNMQHMRGLQIEESIDAIGEGIKSELRRIQEKNKRSIS